MSFASEPELVKKTCWKPGRGDLGEHPPELRGGRMGGVEEGVVVGQLRHLPGRGLRELAPAIADVDAPQPGHRVDVAPAVRVPEMDALRADDDPRAALRPEGAVVGEGVEVVAGVERPQVVRRGSGGRGGDAAGGGLARRHVFPPYFTSRRVVPSAPEPGRTARRCGSCPNPPALATALLPAADRRPGGEAPVNESAGETQAFPGHVDSRFRGNDEGGRDTSVPRVPRKRRRGAKPDNLPLEPPRYPSSAEPGCSGTSGQPGGRRIRPGRAARTKGGPRL